MRSIFIDLSYGQYKLFIATLDMPYTCRDLQNKIKSTNILEEKQKGTEKIFEEIIVENFPNKEDEIVTKVQEVQRVPDR